MKSFYLSASKSIVHEIKFGDIAVIKIQTICYLVTGILVLIGGLRCSKEAKLMDMILDKCIFQIDFFVFSKDMLLVHIVIAL